MSLTDFARDDKPEQPYRKYRMLLHVLFWLSIVIYDVVIWGLVDAKYSEKISSTALELPIKMAAAYFTLYVLIDRYFLNRQYPAFVIGLLLSMALSWPTTFPTSATISSR